METLQIEFQPNVKEKILAFLNSFSKSELKIVEEDVTFEETKKRVHESYRRLKNGETKLYDIDELDAMLEKTISKYEN
jgi:KaiC/GvpD/RAD55 family RecA-like ATPase